MIFHHLNGRHNKVKPNIYEGRHSIDVTADCPEFVVGWGIHLHLSINF